MRGPIAGIIVLLVIVGGAVAYTVWKSRPKPMPVATAPLFRADSKVPPAERQRISDQLGGEYNELRSIHRKLHEVSADALITSYGQPVKREMEEDYEVLSYDSIPELKRPVSILIREGKVWGMRSGEVTIRGARIPAGGRKPPGKPS